MEDKELNPAESIKLIETMINTAKNKLADDGFYFILWGWLVAICSLIHYIYIKLNLPNGHIFWMIFIPIGVISSIVYGWKNEKSKKVKTHVDKYIGYLWGAIGIGMFIVLSFMYFNGFRHTYFFLMILYGIGSFTTGGLLSFKPLIIGSLICFAIAIASVFIGDMEQFLCISLALLFSYIIPGHLLRSSFKSQNV